MNSTKRELFKKDLIELCKKHNMIAVPTYDNKPSAHDPMTVVEFDNFWKDYLNNLDFPPNV